MNCIFISCLVQNHKSQFQSINAQKIHWYVQFWKFSKKNILIGRHCLYKSIDVKHQFNQNNGGVERTTTCKRKIEKNKYKLAVTRME